MRNVVLKTAVSFGVAEPGWPMNQFCVKNVWQGNFYILRASARNAGSSYNNHRHHPAGER
jgi:hypothetical protein